MNSQRLPNGSALKQQITPPADFTNPLKLLEDIIGRPIPDENEGYEGEGQGRVEKPAELVEDVEFGGRSIHDFMEGEDESDGVGTLKSIDDAAQSAMECEYVYSYNIISVLILNVASDERDKDKFEDLHRSILVNSLPYSAVPASC